MQESAIIESTKQETLNPTPQERFDKLDTMIRSSIKGFVEVGAALAEIKRDELWKVGEYKTWQAYCGSIVEYSRSYVHRLMEASRMAQLLGKLKEDGKAPTNEAQVRPLARLENDEDRVAAWTEAVKEAGGDPPSRKLVETVVNRMLPASEVQTVVRQRQASVGDAIKKVEELLESGTPDIEALKESFRKLKEIIAKKGASIGEGDGKNTPASKEASGTSASSEVVVA